jgi:hypothetical protein
MTNRVTLPGILKLRLASSYPSLLSASAICAKAL